jgi:hypothetical protein
MQAPIPKLKKTVAGALLLAAAIILTSCASEKQQVAVVKDPDAQKESAIPWNQQQKWEVGADVSALGATSDHAH